MRQLALGIAAGSLLSVGFFAAAGTGVRSGSGLLLTVAAVDGGSGVLPGGGEPASTSAATLAIIRGTFYPRS